MGSSFETIVDIARDRFKHIAKDSVNRIKSDKIIQVGCLLSIFILIPCCCYFLGVK